MNKILGYLLICVGLLLVFFSLIGMCKIFVDRQPVPDVVQMSDMNVQTQYGVMGLPMNNVNTLANMGLFILFMAFILSAGAKIAGAGCNLLKNERIHDALLQFNDKRENPDEQTLRKL